VSVCSCRCRVGLGGRPAFNGEVGLSHLRVHGHKRKILPTSRGEIFAGQFLCARSAGARELSRAPRIPRAPDRERATRGSGRSRTACSHREKNTRPRTRASWDAGCARCDGNVPVVSHPRRGSRGVRGCPRRRRGRPWAHHSPVPAWSLAPCACDRPARNGGSTSGAGSSLRTQSISHDSSNSIAGRDFQFCVRSPGRPTTSSASSRPRRA